jgi:hypothetical protein
LNIKEPKRPNLARMVPKPRLTFSTIYLRKERETRDEDDTK